MKHLLTLLFLLNFALLFGQTFSYPKIKNEGISIKDFIPKGWTIRDSVSGDLNNDKNNDWVIVLQLKDSVTLVKHDGNYTDTVLTQPRMLLILFHDTSSEKFLLTEQSNSFILNHDNSNMSDPYQSIKIEKGILQISFQLFYNMGSWLITNTSYKFRYQDNNFVLIGADNNSFHRARNDYENYSYNFLTKKWSLTKGSEESEEKPTIDWHSLDLKELKTFKTFKEPYTWEVTKDVYL